MTDDVPASPLLRIVRGVTGGWPPPRPPAPAAQPALAPPIDWEAKPAAQVATLPKEMATGMGSQQKELDGFDQKVALLLTTIGVVMGLGFSGAGSLGPSGVAHLAFYAGMLALLVGLVVGFLGYRPRRVEFVPAPDGLFTPASVDSSPNLLPGLEVEGMAQAFFDNRHVRGVRLAYLNLTLRLLVLGATLLALGYGIGVSGTLR